MRISDAIGEIGTRHAYSTPAQARRARPVIAAAHIVVLTLSSLILRHTDMLNLLNILLSKVKNAGSGLQNAASSVADVGDSKKNT